MLLMMMVCIESEKSCERDVLFVSRSRLAKNKLPKKICHDPIV